MESRGVFSWWNQVERNGTVPHLELILVFSSEKEWNGTIPQNGIFCIDAEPSHSTESVERARSIATNRSLAGKRKTIHPLIAL
jgi:hypothetical protein